MTKKISKSSNSPSPYKGNTNCKTRSDKSNEEGTIGTLLQSLRKCPHNILEVTN